MDMNATLDVTPQFTVSTVQFPSDIANTIVNAILIALIVANINSAVSKLVHLTKKNRFRYASFLRVFIFHNSDDPILLLTWALQAWRARRDPTRRRFRCAGRRLIAPIAARSLILVGSFVSIAISIPFDKSLKGCDQGDVFPDLQRRPLQGSPALRGEGAPVCLESPMETNRGTLRTRANYCSVPVFALQKEVDGSAIVVNYNSKNGILYTGVLSQGEAEKDFVLQATESYVEWLDAQNRNSRSLLPNYRKDAHVAVVLDAIRSIEPGCEKGEEDDSNGFTTVQVGCNFNAVEVSRVAEAYLRNSLRWERRGTIMPRVLVGNTFSPAPPSYCPIDINVSRPLVNMVPLFALLVFLYTINKAVGFTISEYGEVLEQTFVLINEVLGHNMRSAIEKSNTPGVEVLEKKIWECSGDGVGPKSYREGFLKGERCNEVSQFPPGATKGACTCVNRSGTREMFVPEEFGKGGKTV